MIFVAKSNGIKLRGYKPRRAGKMFYFFQKCFFISENVFFSSKMFYFFQKCFFFFKLVKFASKFSIVCENFDNLHKQSGPSLHVDFRILVARRQDMLMKVHLLLNKKEKQRALLRFEFEKGFLLPYKEMFFRAFSSKNRQSAFAHGMVF